jgi:hypothetical protein
MGVPKGPELELPSKALLEAAGAAAPKAGLAFAVWAMVPKFEVAVLEAPNTLLEVEGDATAVAPKADWPPKTEAPPPLPL